MKKILLSLLVTAALLFACASAEIIVWDRNVSADTSAEYIDFGNTVVDDLELLESFLDQFPNLKKCDMFANYMSHAWAESLSARYPNVEFGWTFRIMCTNKDPHIIRTDMTAFSTLHNNRSLQHTSADFSVLKYCRHLLALDIGHNAVDDLSFLYSLPRLRVLIIGRNQVTDLTPLASCPDLEYLEAFSNRIQSVRPLLACTRLMDLNIPNNRIQDPELFAQMRSLKRLWAFNYAWNGLNENHVSPAIRSAVREALPGCICDWSSSGTGGTWRTADGSENGPRIPHYDVIYRMFQSGTYIPFEDSAPLEP